MPEIKNTFLKGRMNLDSHPRLLADGEYREAMNLRLANSEGSEVGSLEKVLGNEALTYYDFGANAKTIGQASSTETKCIYWCTVSDSGSYVSEYNVDTSTFDNILIDTRVGALNVLGFDEDYPITDMKILIDSDNDKVFLFITDNNTFIKYINIARAKTLTPSAFEEMDISLIKRPPIDPPTISLSTTGNEENNIEEEFLYISHRYEYLDGEYSPLSVFSEVGFEAKTFSYDYTTATNNSMINEHNQITIGFNTGDERVVAIEFVYKKSDSNTLYVIEKYIKADEGWSDNNTTYTVDFINNKTHRVLPESQLFRLYDNVPPKAKTLEIIDNRLAIANYTDNHDLVDSAGADVVMDITASLVETAITPNDPTPTCKTIRDYEASLVYLDKDLRQTTALTSANNNVHVPISNSDIQNQIKLTIGHNPPAFAEYYRVYIKSNKGGYESISPILFYDDGAYRWVKLEGADRDKIKEGDYLIVKSDVKGVKDSLVKTKVLEVTSQEKNFLQEDGYASVTVNRAGLYFKIKPKNFILSESDYDRFEISTTGTSANSYDNPLHGITAQVHNAHYYGDDEDRNDMTSGGTYTGGDDTQFRYVVEIDGTTPDTFSWTDGTTSASGVTIDGTAQSLSNGVTVTFASTTGHDTSDSWEFTARGEVTNDGDKSYVFYRVNGQVDETSTDVNRDIITNGTQISLEYFELGAEWEINSSASSKYDDIEEWYWKESIEGKINAQDSFPASTNIYFISSTLKWFTGSFNNYIDENYTDGFMTMVVESKNSQTATVPSVSTGMTEILSLPDGNSILFETEGKDELPDVYYEIPFTYRITGDYHMGNGAGDTNQSSGVDAVITLPFHNAWSWGNGFESYKIKDGFNATPFTIHTRPTSNIADYRENVRTASLTYSGVYEQTSNYNAINEFNLSQENYKDLDDAYGSIQKIWSKDTNLIVFQENKTHNVLYNKDILYSADGSRTVRQSDKILGEAIPYAGEYGISLNPESFAIFGNRIYHTDKNRGVMLRLSTDGYTEISDLKMRDYFRDFFIANPDLIMQGGYDPYTDQFVITVLDKNVTFDEKVSGWTSFHSYTPEGIVNLFNRLYTFKAGQLYLHNSTNGTINTFYGVHTKSDITTIINDRTGNDNIYKTVMTESSDAWDVLLSTKFADSTIYKDEFNQDESVWRGYIRKNEDENDISSRAHGIGNIVSATGLTVTFSAVNSLVSIGDLLYQENSGVPELIGTITANTGGVITVNAITTTPVVARFAYATKDARIEGSEMRGQFLEVTLSDDSADKNDLIAISVNSVKSF